MQRKKKENFAAIRRKIIEPAVIELEREGWKIEWDAIKTGRKVTAVRFDFKYPNRKKGTIEMSKSDQTNPKKGTVKKSKPIDKNEGNKELGSFNLANKPVHIKSVLSDTVGEIELIFEAEFTCAGTPTGFQNFDYLTSGMRSSELIIIGGATSSGKTAFALNIVENVVLKYDSAVLIFSLETSANSLARRMMASLGRIDQHKLRTWELGDDDWPRLTSAINLLAETNLFIDDTPELSINELRDRAVQLASEQGQLNLIVIDYLQLMGSSLIGDNREQQLSEITRGLKALAKELNVPIIALSQLNRNFEKRPNKRPVSSDLRDSGAIEQDADLIVFIYRDELYYYDSDDQGIAEILVSKNRNGPLGTVRLWFIKHYARFEEFTDNDTEKKDAKASKTRKK